jgi:hypothetical protein
MLKLSEAASFFDRTPVLDAYTGVQICFGQVDPYDDSKRDAGSAYRRVLSVAPGTVLPAHSAVRVFGVDWLLGRKEVDGLEELHRDKYVLQPGAGFYRLGTLDQYLAGADLGLNLASPEPVKTAKEIESSSDVVVLYNVYLGFSVPAPKHSVIWAPGEAYLVLSDQTLPSGLRAAYTLELEHPRSTCAVVSRSFNPGLGMYVEGAVSVVSVLRVRWQNLFEYAGQMSERYQEGDDVLVLPSGTVVTVQSRLSAYGKNWSVLSVDDLGGAVTVHARPA